MKLSRFPMLGALAAVLAPAAGAQGLSDAAVAGMPQYVSVKIGSGTSAKTVTQTTVPFVAAVPLGERFNIDIATAYAASDVSANGLVSSSITGLTDTQIRANYRLGNDRVVFTFGANIPTGQYKIEEATEAEAAGQIGNDFLIFPTSSYGSGLSYTGGMAAAFNIGEWNVGAAGSFRKSNPFDAFHANSDTGKVTLTFQPADEMRLRVGVDRVVGEGRLALGVTFSSFGKDVLANTSYATGDRYIGQASLYYPLLGVDWYLSGWGLYRAEGQQFGGVSKPESVVNGALSAGIRLGNYVLEPSFESRYWMVDGAKSGLLFNPGLRLRFGLGPFTVIPNATFQSGKLYPNTDNTSINVVGWRGSLTIRIH